MSNPTTVRKLKKGRKYCWSQNFSGCGGSYWKLFIAPAANDKQPTDIDREYVENEYGESRRFYSEELANQYAREALKRKIVIPVL